MASVLPRQHKQRLELANELHARPFPEVGAPSRAVHIAFHSAPDGVRDRSAERDHLIALIDRHGGPHPPPEADHYSGSLARALLKWERHTEFVTYTLFAPGVADQPFRGGTLDLLPQDWLDAAPGPVLVAALVRIEPAADARAAEALLEERIAPALARESLSASRVSGGTALAAADFRVHEDGFARIAVMATPEAGEPRLGRAAQRLLEIETYRAASMLTLPVAREANRRLSEIDAALSDLVGIVSAGDAPARDSLERLTRLSAEIERLGAESAFRFGAARAYAAIVRDRLAALGERRIEGRQTLAEFLARRYEPAMRTCESAERRLEGLASRSVRVANLLRTSVEVGIADQNTELLQSMDRRAALQIRLQETVEGLSVVAISYYAVSLAGYLFAPLGARAGLDKTALLALATPPAVLLVWLLVRRIRRKVAARTARE